MRYKTVILLLLICFSPLGEAAATDRYVDFTFGYNQGDFNTGQTVKLSSLQVTYGQITGPYDISLSVPYLYLSDNFGDEYGLGDITLLAGMAVSGSSLTDTSLYASVAIKLPTADETKELGTGEMDTGGFLTYTQRFKTVRLSLMGGYIVTGDSITQQYKDIVVYGVGLSKIIIPWYVYGSLDGRQNILNDSDDPLEISTGFFYQVKQTQFIKMELFAGLSDSSPDVGLSIGIVNWF